MIMIDEMSVRFGMGPPVFWQSANQTAPCAQIVLRYRDGGAGRKGVCEKTCPGIKPQIDR